MTFKLCVAFLGLSIPAFAQTPAAPSTPEDQLKDQLAALRDVYLNAINATLAARTEAATAQRLLTVCEQNLKLAQDGGTHKEPGK
jgi:hypothetical protein